MSEFWPVMSIGPGTCWSDGQVSGVGSVPHDSQVTTTLALRLIRLARSGWVASAPESMIPTVTPLPSVPSPVGAGARAVSTVIACRGATS